MEQKTFSLEEANKILPKVQPLLEKVLEVNEKIKAANNDITILEEIWGERINQPGNPDNRLYNKKITVIKEKSKELERHIEKINEIGGIVKDLNQGLVDFYHEKDGELVFLCWKHGEDKIKYWHTLGGGYTGRRSLDEIGIKTK